MPDYYLHNLREKRSYGIYFGDYGSVVSADKDLRLNAIFGELGLLEDNGEPLTTAGFRDMNRKHVVQTGEVLQYMIDSPKKIDGKAVSISMGFISGRDEVNCYFNMMEISDEWQAQLIKALENLKCSQWKQ